MEPIKLDRADKQGHRVGGFGIEILYPGLALGQGDSGIGAIGRIDHAQIRPGTLIRMHPHCDDEILSYMRRGLMLHRDTMGHEEEVSPTRLMLMNAGHTFQHEERMGGTEDIAMLQIFLRPHAADLEPTVQFRALDTLTSPDAWRLIAGPEGTAPLEVRASAWVQDARLSQGGTLALPDVPVPGAVRLLYVFTGRGVVDGTVLSEGDSLILDDRATVVEAQADTDLVLFTTDPTAPVFTGGMFSGNIAAL